MDTLNEDTRKSDKKKKRLRIFAVLVSVVLVGGVVVAAADSIDKHSLLRQDYVEAAIVNTDRSIQEAASFEGVSGEDSVSGFAAGSPEASGVLKASNGDYSFVVYGYKIVNRGRYGGKTYAGKVTVSGTVDSYTIKVEEYRTNLWGVLELVQVQVYDNVWGIIEVDTIER